MRTYYKISCNSYCKAKRKRTVQVDIFKHHYVHYLYLFISFISLFRLFLLSNFITFRASRNIEKFIMLFRSWEGVTCWSSPNFDRKKVAGLRSSYVTALVGAKVVFENYEGLTNLLAISWPFSINTRLKGIVMINKMIDNKNSEGISWL